MSSECRLRFRADAYAEFATEGAKFALFPIIASQLLLIVLTVTAAVQRLLRRSPSVAGGQASTSA